MEKEVAGLVEKVKVVLDQNMDSDTLQGLRDIDTLSLDELIRSKIPDAARIIEQAAPTFLLGAGKVCELLKTVVGESEPKYLVATTSYQHLDPVSEVAFGDIALPDDFLRLISLKTSQQPIPATDAISDDSPLYVRLFSRYPGIRGNWIIPVAVLTRNADGEQVLRVYPHHATSNRVQHFTYVPLPKITTNQNQTDVIEIPERLSDAIVYYAAYLVAATVEQEKAKALLETAKEMAMIEEVKG